MKILQTYTLLFFKIIVIFSALSLLAYLLISDLKTNLTETGNIQFTNVIPIENEIFKDFVYIEGQVLKPGKYELQEGMRIIDLLELAGNYTPEADVNYLNANLNLNEVITTNQKIFIPKKQDTNKTLININTASKQELDTLPGIGESTANKIIAGRPFKSIDELKDTQGVGESKFNQIKDFITIFP